MTAVDAHDVLGDLTEPRRERLIALAGRTVEQADVKERDRLVVLSAEIQAAVVRDLDHQIAFGFAQQSDRLAQGALERDLLVGGYGCRKLRVDKRHGVLLV